MTVSRKFGRKTAITPDLVVGLLESSAHLDEFAAARRKEDAARYGTVKRRQAVPPDGTIREVTFLERAYSLGITQGAQVLAGLAAELALKYVWEDENSGQSAAGTHKLHNLFRSISRTRRDEMDADYKVRLQRHANKPPSGWQTLDDVFRTTNDYFESWRYVSEEGAHIPYVEPRFLREAVCSVLKTMGVNVNWATESASAEQ